MVGRQTPFLALIVPLILVVHGRRPARPAPGLAGGAGRRRAPSRSASSRLELHLGRAHRHRRLARSRTAAIVALLRVWQPGEPLHRRRAAAGAGARPAMAGGRPLDADAGAPRSRRRDDARRRDTARATCSRPTRRTRSSSRSSRSPRSASVKDALAERGRTSSTGRASTCRTPRASAELELDVQVQLAAGRGHADADLAA